MGVDAALDADAEQLSPPPHGAGGLLAAHASACGLQPGYRSSPTSTIRRRRPLALVLRTAARIHQPHTWMGHRMVADLAIVDGDAGRIERRRMFHILTLGLGEGLRICRRAI